MATIQWRESYSTGVDKFDEEHRVLVDMINEMYVAVRDKRDEQFLEKIIKDLRMYTKKHFDYEEQEMESSGYPLVKEHKEEHRRLIAEVEEYYEQVKHNIDDLSPDFYKFLRNWLIRHILKNDMKYKSHFAKLQEPVA